MKTTNGPLRGHGDADDDIRPILTHDDFGEWKSPPPDTESEWRFIQSIIVCFFVATVLGAAYIGAVWAIWNHFSK